MRLFVFECIGLERTEDDGTCIVPERAVLFALAGARVERRIGIGCLLLCQEALFPFGTHKGIIELFGCQSAGRTKAVDFLQFSPLWRVTLPVARFGDDVRFLGTFTYHITAMIACGFAPVDNVGVFGKFAMDGVKRDF